MFLLRAALGGTPTPKITRRSQLRPVAQILRDLIEPYPSPQRLSGHQGSDLSTVTNNNKPAKQMANIFFAGNEEAAGVVEPGQSLEVDVGSVHNVEGTGLGHEIVKDVDIVELAVADEDK